MTPLASDRLSRIRALQAELITLIESGAPDSDGMAFDIALAFIAEQSAHINELSEILAEARDALRLATIPERWCYQACDCVAIFCET